MTPNMVKELEAWDERIKEIVDSFGLNPFPQIFEICDHNQMLGYNAYSGMPSRYPHWSFGKQFEKQKTLYDYGMAGLPYEMVINSNPCLAYLMTDNTLLLQILTIAHVYAHNDFFKNNITFKNTHPEYTLEKFKAHADRIRKYTEDTGIGLRKVEETLDAAHAVSMNCGRYSLIKKLNQREQKDRRAEASSKIETRFNEPYKIEAEEEKSKPENKKIPVEPDEDILLFIRDYNRRIPEWKKDLLTIVAEETQYFIPQIETKIMNEGWASYWHKKILETLELPQEMRMEFMVRHNQVLRPIPKGLNPYYLGFKIYEDIEQRWDEPSGEEKEEFKRPGGQGKDKIFQVRETDRDESFLRQYLTKELMREMNLYQHEKRGKDRVVTKVASEEDWLEVKNTIISNTGMNSFPVIKIHDADYERQGKLLLAHEYDGRELDSEYAKRTLKYLYCLWGAPVILETTQSSRKIQLVEDESENN
ncbi:SpoVR family protein [bacterium]|nr:SpoVR family protein [bacterium]